jgi:flagellar hook capping protein FlgD
MLSRLMRFVLLSASIAALPAAFAGAAPSNSAGHPVVRANAPATLPLPKPDVTSAAPTARGGAVNRIAVPMPSAPTELTPQALPTVTGRGPNASRSSLPTDTGLLAVRPAVAPVKILYAPSEADDPAFRAAVAAITGGVVDYFDARVGTPTAGVLAGYNCVYTLADASYNDRVTFGDRLADFVDAGGKVILGVFCTYTTGNSLGGRIMTPGYSPVTSPLGTNHFSNSAYAGDGFRSMHAGVLAYDDFFRDILVTQGGGIANGHYADGEIAQAYRPDGRVIYSNGTGSVPLAGTGDWAKIIANAAMANPAAHGMLMAPADADDPAYRANISALTTGVVDFFNANAATPTAALLHTYDCVYTWPNSNYNDAATFGNRLADRVDEGARVILGAFCTFTSVNSLSGRIMTPDYCPVTSPGGNNHFVNSVYGGDGSISLTSGIGPVDCMFRDLLVGQGAGIVDGHYIDGEILAAYRPDGRVVYANGGGSSNILGTGNWPQLIANACEFVPPPGHRILYAPSDADDPVFRARLAENTGGVVDYFNANAGTPSAAFLSGYDCVYTWPNNPYSDPALFGNRLADFVDAGGKVILGTFSTYSIFALGGRIMTPAYSPVANPANNSHYSLSAYAGDGTSCFHHGVATYATNFRDFLVLQGAGIAESHYADAEIAVAYRPDRRVVYVNGLFVLSTGDWPRLIANGCDCGDTPGVLFASNSTGQLFTLNSTTGAATFDLNLPSNGIGGGSTEIEFMPSGQLWVQERDGAFAGEQVDPYTGAATTARFPTARAYNGVEYALGRLWAAGITGGCGASTWATVDPTAGTELTTYGATGQPPLVGLAFDRRWSTMYGVTSGCAGFSNLVRIDVTNGQAVVLGSTGFRLGSLEFGPNGDLYGGGDNTDGGHLYRVNQATGFAQLIGSTGMGNVTGITLGVNGTVAARPAPAALEFSTPYPNPSRSGIVQFRFSIPTASDVHLELYDVAGRLRWSEALAGLGAGLHTVTWNGLGSNGARLASGIYHMRLVSSAGSRTVRIVRFD